MDDSSASFITPLKIIHTALMLGVFFFLVISEVLILTGGAFIENDTRFEQIFLAIAAVTAVAAIGGGISFVRKKLEGLQQLMAKEERMAQYRSLLIIRAALMEGPAFLFVVGNLLFGKVTFIICAAVCLAAMAAYFPTKTRVENEMGMTVE
jgi:hypothetical protein